MIAAKTSLNRAALKGGAATFVLALLATPLAVSAQTTAAAASNEDAAIIVTGSLIRNPNLVSATPINVTTADTIQLRGSNVAEEVLRDLPGIVPSIGSAVNNGNGGASYVNLRGIGNNRNLVLLDGDRITPSDQNGRVDLNNIPLALVQRVDTQTGAAVTTYGADAISGVVNFVTKTDFTGVELQVSNGITEKGDGYTFRADLTVGGNFDDGRGNAVLSIGYQKADPVYQGARDFSTNNLSSFTGGANGSGTSVPSRFSNTRSITGGVINTTAPYTATGVSTFLVDPMDPTKGFYPTFAAVPGGATNGPSRQVNPLTGFTNSSVLGIKDNQVTQTNPFAPFNFNPYNIFQTPFTRFNVFGQANYEISDSIEVYSRALFSKNTVDTIIAPSGSFGSTVTINLSNPYLPAGLRNQFCARNVAPLVNGVVGVDKDGKPIVVGGQTAYTPFLTQAQCDAAATAAPTLANGSANPDYKTVSTVLARRAVEVGPRISSYQTTIFDYKAGLRGKITDAINWDVSGSYGESENIQTISGYVLTSRLRQASLATNTTTCITPTGGCVPVNLFGPLGSISQTQADYLTATSTVRNKTSLGQVRGLVSGDLPFALPSASDNVAFAVGAEYRRYTASQASDVLAQTPGELGGAGGAAPNLTGAYNVKEAFGELIAPLVQDKPFFQNLTLEAGARYSSYKVSAPSNPGYNTFTWKAGGTWEVTQGLKIRGNFSRAVRAPNIGELFTPVTVGLTNIGIDPCAGTTPVGNANLTAVCIAQGARADQIGSILNPTAGQGNQTSGGNINIKPEKANTWTAGIVLQPVQVPGLSLTVDFWSIRVTDAITSPTAADALAACFTSTPTAVSASAVTSAACTGIRRNPGTGGLDGDPSTTLGLPLALSNSGKITTRGIDASVAYSRDIGFAKLGIQANATYTLTSRFQSIPTSIDRECVGYFSPNCGIISGSPLPKFQSSLRTTLGFNDFDVSLNWRHLSGLQNEPQNIIDNGQAYFVGVDGNGDTVDYNKIKSYNIFDLAGRFNLMKNLTLTASVSNLFNVKPPGVGSNAGTTSFNSGNTYPSTYDALGRRYTMQVAVRF